MLTLFEIVSLSFQLFYKKRYNSKIIVTQFAEVIREEEKYPFVGSRFSQNE
jgi:hypothetical protein